MSVTNETTRISTNGDGTTLLFTVPFSFFDKTELVVLLVRADGSEVAQTLAANYTVAGGCGSTGALTLNTAPANGERLVVYRSSLAPQQVSELDRVIMRNEEQDDKLDRALCLSESSEFSGPLQMEDPVAGRALKWNAAEDAIVNTSVDLEVLEADVAAAAAQTALDRIATGSDVVTSNADVVQTAADVVTASGHANAAAANTAQTALDRIATGADVVTSNASVSAAQLAASNAAISQSNAALSATSASLSAVEAAASAAAVTSIIAGDGLIRTGDTFSVDLGYVNGVPQNNQSSDYTAVLSDAGKHLFHPAADTTARTFTIPANASVAFEVGTELTFVNQQGAGLVTIAIDNDTLLSESDGAAGSFTLAANKIAKILKIAPTEWMLSGSAIVMDNVPIAFSFADVTGQSPSTLVTSNTVTVSGINVAADIMITGGAYSVNGDAFTSTQGTVLENDTVRVQLTSSGNFSASTSATVTIGSVSGTFTATTKASATVALASSSSNAATLVPTYVFSNQSIGLADPTRRVFVIYHSFGAAPGSATFVTIGGVVASSHYSAKSASNEWHISLWSAAVPSGTSASISVTHNGSNPYASGIGVFSANNVSSALSDGAVVTYPSGNATDPSYAIDCPAGGIVISGISANNVVSWSGLTENYELNAETTARFSGASDAFESSQTNRTITANRVGTYESIAVFASFGPA